MADYDAIVVGAGLSGSTAAYLMAKAGLSVLVVERGDSAGSKNVTGGRLYGHSLEKIIPGFADEAPVERKVMRERITMTGSSDRCGGRSSSFRLGFWRAQSSASSWGALS